MFRSSRSGLISLGREKARAARGFRGRQRRAPRWAQSRPGAVKRASTVPPRSWWRRSAVRFSSSSARRTKHAGGKPWLRVHRPIAAHEAALGGRRGNLDIARADPGVDRGGVEIDGWVRRNSGADGSDGHRHIAHGGSVARAPRFEFDVSNREDGGGRDARGGRLVAHGRCGARRSSAEKDDGEAKAPHQAADRQARTHGQKPRPEPSTTCVGFSLRD